MAAPGRSRSWLIDCRTAPPPTSEVDVQFSCHAQSRLTPRLVARLRQALIADARGVLGLLGRTRGQDPGPLATVELAAHIECVSRKLLIVTSTARRVLGGLWTDDQKRLMRNVGRPALDLADFLRVPGQEVSAWIARETGPRTAELESRLDVASESLTVFMVECLGSGPVQG